MSNCKRFISITNFDIKHPQGEYFKVMAYNKERLTDFPIPKVVENSLNQYYEQNSDIFYEFEELSLCGTGKYIQLVYREIHERSIKEQ